MAVCAKSYCDFNVKVSGGTPSSTMLWFRMDSLKLIYSTSQIPGLGDNPSSIILEPYHPTLLLLYN